VNGTIYCARRRSGTKTFECVCWGYSGAPMGFTKHVSSDCMTPTSADIPWN
jgi:hypothetical protein